VCLCDMFSYILITVTYTSERLELCARFQVVSFAKEYRKTLITNIVEVFKSFLQLVHLRDRALSKHLPLLHIQ